MKPELNRVDLTKLSRYNVDKICPCQVKCKEGVSFTTYNDGVIVCRNSARLFLYELMRELDDGKSAVWTEEDEKIFIDHVKEHGNYRGMYRVLAEMLGKTYQQCKTKGRLLKEKGLI